MALTVNQFTGFETGGIEEASNTTGSPDATEATIVRNGDRSLRMPDGTHTYTIPLFSEVSNAGNDHIFGFGFYTPSGALSTFIMLEVQDSSGSIIMDLEINSAELVQQEDSLGNFEVSFTANLGEWNFIEIYFQNTGTGSTEIFLNGISQGTSTGDFDTGTALDRVVIKAESAQIGNFYYDDFYWLSGATAASDRLGTGARVTGNQHRGAGAGPDFDSSGVAGGTNLSFSTWTNMGDRPWNDSNLGAYRGSGAENGCVAFDQSNASGDSQGPLSGPDTIGTIKAAKWMWRGDRSGGGATTHAGLYGAWDGSGNMDSIGNTGDLGLAQGTINDFFVIKEASDGNVPTASEDFVMGLDKSAGGRDWDCYEMHAMLLHVVSAAAVSPVLRHPIRNFQHNLVR